VSGECLPRALLLGVENRSEPEVLGRTDSPFVEDSQGAASLGDGGGEGVDQAAGKHEAAVESLVVAAQEAGHVPGRGAPALPFVEQWIRHGSGVLEGRGQRRGQVGAVHGDIGTEGGADERWRRRLGAAGGRLSEAVNGGADPESAEGSGRPLDFAGCHPSEAG